MIISTALNQLAIDSNRMLTITASGKWLLDIQDRANKKNPPKEFTNLIKESVTYPHELGTEKHPINKIYFENHPSLSCEHLNINSSQGSLVEIKAITIKIFESSALTATCNLRVKNYKKEHNVDEAIKLIKNARLLAQKLLFSSLQDFVIYWNILVPSTKLLSGGMREFLAFDKYEYINFELSQNDNCELNKDLWGKNERYDLEKEIVGFSRMSKHYTWTTFQKKFIIDFLDNDVSNRTNEIWIIFRERFVRYYPDKTNPEASHFAQFIPLLIEILLGLKAVYKSYLENTRTQIATIPLGLGNTISNNNKNSILDLQKFQQELTTTTLQLSKIHYPSDVEFYANTDHAFKMLKQLEKILSLDRLSNSLQSEQEKLKGVIDSYSNLSIHKDSMKLQQNVLWLTIVVGAIGVILAIIQILVELKLI